MYAAVRVYEGITDDAEAGRLVDESFLPLLDQVKGFIAYYWIDAGDGAMASLSVFDDKAGADESVKLAHQWVQENAAELIPNPPKVTEGLVVASETKSARPSRWTRWRVCRIRARLRTRTSGKVKEAGRW